MQMESPKRKKTGGRKLGTPNKRSGELLEILDRLSCNPAEGMAQIANGDYTCTVCLGKRKLKYRRREDGELVFDGDEGTLMDCVNCFGSGKEPIPVGLRLKAMAELQQYVYPKRKAVEVQTPKDGKGDFTLADLLATMRSVTDG
jgi:hypothetical protein